MDWLRKLKARWDGESDVAEEVRLHQAERAAELEASGVPADQAGFQARREFGNAFQSIEDSRAAWHLGWMEDLFADLRYGARALARDRGFALTAIASLALGIGVNTTVFSLASEFLFSEPSAAGASRLVAIRLGGNSHAEPVEFRYLRDAGLFEGLAAIRDSEVNWRFGDSSRRLFSFKVSREFFGTLRVPVEMGRGIEPADGNVAVIAHRVWRTALQSDPNILGRVLVLDGRPHTVVGVLPDDHRSVFGFGLSPDVYVRAEEDRDMLALYARMPETMTRAGAWERTVTAARDLDGLYPDPNHQRADRVEVEGLSGASRLGGRKALPLRAFLAMLMAAVGLVLLIACTNVASLMLARASARSQELAVRSSIGASRGRIVRQLLAESLLISALGTAAGIVVNLLLTGAINRVRIPLPLPIYLHIQPDRRLLVYSVLLAVATALLAGLLPALQAARIAHGARLTGGGSRLRAALVTGQVAVTFVVLAAAFLFVRNLARSSAMSPGFEVNRLVWASVRLVPEQYAAGGRVAALAAVATERLRALPGVEQVSLTRVVPFNGLENNGGMVRADEAAHEVRVQRVVNRVSPEYFRTMGIPMMAGREFQAAEPGVAVINEAFARAVWGTVDPVGRVLHIGERRVTILGVCRNTRFQTIGEEDRPAMYEPYDLAGDQRTGLEWMIRTGSPAGLTRSVERVLLDLDSSAAVEARPMSKAMGMALLPSQVGAGLMGAIGGLGLVLAAIGLYGVLVYGVARRRREIGVRMALGARAGHILRLVLGDGAWIVGVGLAIGIVVAALVMRPLAMFLVAGLEPEDPWNYAVVAGALSLVAALASIAPVLRAVRVDPNETLRAE